MLLLAPCYKLLTLLWSSVYMSLVMCEGLIVVATERSSNRKPILSEALMCALGQQRATHCPASPWDPQLVCWVPCTYGD